MVIVLHFVSRGFSGSRAERAEEEEAEADTPSGHSPQTLHPPPATPHSQSPSPRSPPRRSADTDSPLDRWRGVFGNDSELRKQNKQTNKMTSTEVLKEGNVFLGRSLKNILSISAVSGLLANHCLLSARASLSAGLLFYIWFRKVSLRCEAGRGGGEEGGHSTDPPPQLPLPIPHTPQPGFTGPVL